MRIREETGFTFDDVLIEPRFSEVDSRHAPDVSARIGEYTFKIPILAAPMDKVCGVEMCIALDKLGGLGVLHRFMSIEDQVRGAVEIKRSGAIVCCALGYKDLEDRARALKLYADMFLIDVANGHTAQMRDALYALRQLVVKPVIAGNIATGEAASDYNEWGVTAYRRVGIGPGKFCQTRSVTGCGVPQITAIDNVHSAAPDKTIIADGGIRNSGDIVKALAAGADFVMLGNLLAGTDEAPGEIFIDEQKQKYKICRGMASREANGRPDVAPEGVSIRVPYKGPVVEVLKPLVMGLKSGMSYVGARTIAELQERAVFIPITANGSYESMDRIKRDS